MASLSTQINDSLIPWPNGQKDTLASKIKMWLFRSLGVGKQDYQMIYPPNTLNGASKTKRNKV